jgi:hypothetical protein
MTEEEWLVCDTAAKMLGHLGTHNSPHKRKARLLACAAVRRVWHLLHDERHRSAVATAEQFADGLVTEAQWESSLSCFAFGFPPAAERAAHHAASYGHFPPHYSDTVFALRSAVSASGDVVGERLAQVGLVRDIFGNPFRPVVSDPSWLTTTVVALARRIYEERAFDHLPILADALEDAGCGDERVLYHCRSPGLHVCGCWALDLVLFNE